MEPHKFGAHIQKLICVLKLLKQGISDFNTVFASLHNYLEHIYDIVKRSTSNALSHIVLSEQH